MKVSNWLLVIVFGFSGIASAASSSCQDNKYIKKAVAQLYIGGVVVERMYSDRPEKEFCAEVRFNATPRIGYSPQQEVPGRVLISFAYDCSLKAFQETAAACDVHQYPKTSPADLYKVEILIDDLLADIPN